MGNCCPGSKDEQGRGLNAPSSLVSSRNNSILEPRRRTLAPNMKNFKNLKFVENVLDFYSIGDQLGKGSFGSVNKCVRLGSNTECAIKVIEKESLNSNPMLPVLMMNELQVLQKSSHPHIMNVNELLEDDDNYYIVTELLEGGELFDRLLEVKNFNEPKAAYIVKQVLLALNYMHS